MNLDKAAIPQADELQRLLVNMIHFMIDNYPSGSSKSTPLPRFWYLPNMKKAAILMAGDDHGAPNSTASLFNTLHAESPQNCSVADWSCYRATGWLYTDSGLTDAQALEYKNQGFDLGAHVNTNCQDWTPQTLEDFFTLDLADFEAKYLSLPAQKTNRTHCFVWSDWATHPKVERNHGIRLDRNYYYWPPQWVQNRPGFMTGSGFPMRYADVDGSIIDVYQAATHLTNETDATSNSINSLLDKALVPEGYYGVFGTHYDYRGDGFEVTILNSARARDVSLISAQQLLTWLEGRNSSSFGNVIWWTSSMELELPDQELRFSITVGAGADNLFVIIPNQGRDRQLRSLTIDDTPVSFEVQTIKGRSYAVFRAATGTVKLIYSP